MAKLVSVRDMLIALEEKRLLDKISNEWEYNFIESMEARIASGQTESLSAKQVEKVEEIYLRHFG